MALDFFICIIRLHSHFLCPRQGLISNHSVQMNNFFYLFSDCKILGLLEERTRGHNFALYERYVSIYPCIYHLTYRLMALQGFRSTSASSKSSRQQTRIRTRVILVMRCVRDKILQAGPLPLGYRNLQWNRLRTRVWYKSR